MAHLKGLLSLHGTIDGLNFYSIKGNKKTIVRRKPGPTAEQFKTSKKYERSRENSCEFAAGSSASAILRHSLLPYSKTIGSSYLSGSLTKEFQKIAMKGDGLRGKRSIILRQHKEILMGFDLNRNLSLESILRIKPIVHFNEDRNIVELVLPEFNPQTDIYAPSGATHVEFIHAIAIQPAFTFHFDYNEYRRSDKQNTIIQQSILSEKIPLVSEGIFNVSLSLSTPENISIHADSALISALGIRFYQQVGFNMFELESGKVMQIVGID